MRRALPLLLAALIAGCATSNPQPQQPPPLPPMGSGGGQGNTAATIETTLVAPEDPLIHVNWKYPTNRLDSIDAFCIYTTTNLAVPISSWPKTVTLTNWTPIVIGTNALLTVDFSMFPEQRFFYVTSSNFWNESNPSNTARTPHPPLLVNQLEISR